MKIVIENDNYNYPVKGIPKVKPSHPLEPISAEQLQRAKQLIDANTISYEPTFKSKSEVSSYNIEPELAKISKLQQAKVLNNASWQQAVDTVMEQIAQASKVR
jgi:hypothetical protein